MTQTNTTANAVLRVPPAAPPDAATYFAARSRFHADVTDVHSALASGEPGFALIDARGPTAWAQGHIPGAIHLPHAEIPARAPGLLDPAVPVVTYCWGPACDGATRAALALASLGYQVKEMIGGVEYWIREGFPVQTSGGLVHRPPDPLTVPVVGITCDC